MVHNRLEAGAKKFREVFAVSLSLTLSVRSRKWQAALLYLARDWVNVLLL
jgi:hypothetical protein